jgi:hypothetical protein
MKKLSIVLICALALGLIFENAFARGFNYCNFFLEHENLEDWSVHEEAINDDGLIMATESLDTQVYLNSPPELIGIGFMNEDAGSKTLDGFDVNLSQLSEKMESFELTLKMDKSDSVGKERNDYYFKGMNYSIAFSFNF